MRGFVANTDIDWYQFLRARPELREVNFWRPNQSRFAALESGELFFFKLKAPHNAITGFGLFTRGVVLPVWEAWDVFGAANGVPHIDALLARLRDLSHGSGEAITVDDWIGCLAIAEPVFLPPDSWVPAPADWSRQIVSGKGYDLTSGGGYMRRAWMRSPPVTRLRRGRTRPFPPLAEDNPLRCDRGWARRPSALRSSTPTHAAAPSLESDPCP